MSLSLRAARADRTTDTIPLGVRRLDRWDLLVLLGTLLGVVGPLRAGLGWLALFVAPGWFFARKVVGARGLLLAALCLALSVAFAPVVVLPALVAVGEPTRAVVLGSLLAFFAVCCVVPQRLTLSAPPLPAPHAAWWLGLTGFVGLRVAVAFLVPYTVLAGNDPAYFVGMVKGLSVAFPPANYEASSIPLTQPWGYWLLYALAHRVTGLSIPLVLGLASALVAGAFLILLYVTVAVMTASGRAASWSLPLAFVGMETYSIWKDLRDGELGRTIITGDWGMHGTTLWSALYTGPPLLLLLLVLLLLELYASSRAATLLVLWLTLAVFPLHHPVFFVWAALLVAGHAVARWRRPDPALASLLLAPVPFYVLFVLLYAPEQPRALPFSVEPTVAEWVQHSLLRAQFLFWHSGLLVVALPVAVLRVRGRVNPLAALLVVATVVVSIGTNNVGNNVHWLYGPLWLGATLLFAPAFGTGAVGPAALAVRSCLVALGLWIAQWDAVVARRGPTPTPLEEEIAAWARTTDERAAFVVPRADRLVSVIEGMGERRIFAGSPGHLTRVASASDVEGLVLANELLLRNPGDSMFAEARVDYVVLRKDEDAARVARWAQEGPPKFENAEVAIWAAPRPDRARAPQ